MLWIIMNIWQEPSKPLLNNSSIILKKLPLTFLAVDGCHWHVRYEEEELLGIPKGKLSKSLSWQFIDTSLQRIIESKCCPPAASQHWRAPIRGKKEPIVVIGDRQSRTIISTSSCLAIASLSLTFFFKDKTKTNTCWCFNIKSLRKKTANQLFKSNF